MTDLKKQLIELQSRLDQVKIKLDPNHRARLVRELEAKSTRPDFWSNPDEAKSVMKRLSELQQEKESLAYLETEIHDAIGLTDLMSDDDTQLIKEVKQIDRKLSKLEIKTFLNGPYDSGNAIVSIHAGQGGTEAMDWVSMLLRMYLRYCESRDWVAEIVDQTVGEEAGLKSVSLTITGPFAYGYLSGERGTHRLVRQSPFNADNLRQTSFALVEVMPELPEDDPQINIPPQDLQFEAFRSGGHGGQNVNKVSTAVRLTHIPSGITVTCQTQRYQEQNRKIALNLLKAKLWQVKMETRAENIKELKGEYKTASWGNQIRSYVLHPYKLVKDLRTNVETSQAGDVLDGHLDEFIDAQIRTLKK
jgi:peptide chain release factor 2